MVLVGGTRGLRLKGGGEMEVYKLFGPLLSLGFSSSKSILRFLVDGSSESEGILSPTFSMVLTVVGKGRK